MVLVISGPIREDFGEPGETPEGGLILSQIEKYRRRGIGTALHQELKAHTLREVAC
jgi:RimJ/RimL family protein N-acetyltransferase